MVNRKIAARHVKTRWEGPSRRKAGVAGGEPVSRGGTAYREEYQPDHGPDLDEPLDRAESEHEF